MMYRLKRKGWTDSNDFHYYVSRYAEDGRKRGLVEEVLILACIIINNEVPDFALTERQREVKEMYENLAPVTNKSKESELRKLNQAVEYAIALDIKTPAEAEKMALDESLPLEIRTKASHVCVMLDCAMDKDYCYGRFDSVIDVLEEKMLKTREKGRDEMER